jgi:hypothetical protein
MEVEVTPFSRETDEVLRRARITEAMPVEKRRRLKAAVLARLAAGGITLVAGEAVAATGFWASAVGGAVKGIAAMAVVASVGVGGYMAARPSSVKVPAAAPARAVVVEPRPVAAPEPAAPAVREAAAPSPRVRAARTPERSSKPVELVFVPPPAPPPVATAAAAPLERSTLTEETRLLREADRALRGGSAEAAISLLDEHASRFPDGVLAPERSAERMIALCQLGKADASTATRFLASRSNSPLAARIRQACNVPTR